MTTHAKQNCAMDHSTISASVFHKLADRYREKYMDLTMYDDSYREFCQLLPQGRARVLDAACGPGNVSRYLMAQRPDLDLLGIDLAPRMVELAREAVPSAQFAVQDCRHLVELQRRFDGIICAFGLPYLSGEEARAFIRVAGQALDPGRVLYLSTMLGQDEDSGFESCSTGDQVYINYHSEDQVFDWLRRCGFTLLKEIRIPSPSAAPKPTTDLIVMAKK
jgi:SAM-dependent methyltransferase